ncbi:MAG: DUF3025 domain-containing protein [Burkholderiales bacterium]|jgi:hypothetical protein
MVTDQRNLSAPAQTWSLEWIQRSPMFDPLAPVASRLPANNWPDIADLNAMPGISDGAIVNASGKPIHFVEQTGKATRFEDEFEPRTYLRGEVLVRRQSWHDLFNALVWMTFPRAKASINARHFVLLRESTGRQRTSAGDALTHFDEDGVVVISSNRHLLQLLRDFRWKDLFWHRRDAVGAEMRFLLFGHAMYEKALRPFVGMTAKSVLLQMSTSALELEHAALNDLVDAQLATSIRDPGQFTRGRALAPLPVLGVPGWWPRNDSAGFYEDTSHFRPGRLADSSSG